MSEQTEDFDHLFSFKSPDIHVRDNPNLPPMWYRAYQLMKSVSDITYGAVERAISGQSPNILLDNEIYNSRISICRACNHFRVTDERCGSPDAQEKWGCGCYVSDHFTQAGIKVPGKARFRDAHCPLAPPKW